MAAAAKRWSGSGAFALCSLLLSACGGGVSSSSNNTLTQGSTTAPPVGNAAITVNAPALILANTGELNPTYSCPANTQHLTPAISWTPGPAGTTYYVVMVEDVQAINAPASTNPPTHWLVRTGSNTLSLPSATGNVNNPAIPGVVSNDYVPPFSSDGNPHTYNVRVYAMSALWLSDPTQVVATDPGRDFSNPVLPGLNTFPTALPTDNPPGTAATSNNYYYGGNSNLSNGFEILFGSTAATNLILGSGVATGSYNANGTPSSGC